MLLLVFCCVCFCKGPCVRCVLTWWDVYTSLYMGREGRREGGREEAMAAPPLLGCRGDCPAAYILPLSSATPHSVSLDPYSASLNSSPFFFLLLLSYASALLLHHLILPLLLLLYIVNYLLFYVALCVYYVFHPCL